MRLTHCQAGYLSEAFEIYTKALALKPNDTVCLLNMGGARQEQGRFREAIVFYEKILETDPTDTGALNNLGGALMLTGEFKRLSACRSAITFLSHAFYLAYCFPLGREEDALAALQKALDVDPDAYNALVNLGVYHQNRGDLVRRVAE